MKKYYTGTSIPYSILMNLVFGLAVILLPALVIYHIEGWGVFQATMWMFYSTLVVLWKTVKYPIRVKKRNARAINVDSSASNTDNLIRKNSSSERYSENLDQGASSGIYIIKSKLLNNDIRVRIVDDSLIDPATGEFQEESVNELFERCAKFGGNPHLTLISVHTNSGLCIANLSQEFAYRNLHEGPSIIIATIMKCEEISLEAADGKEVREAAEVCMQLLNLTNGFARKRKYSKTALLEGAIAFLHFQAKDAKQELGLHEDEFHEYMRRSETIGGIVTESLQSDKKI